MKLRKDFLIALIVLFAIPITGYFVLRQAAKDRMKISATLQPKDSIDLKVAINYLNEEGVPRTSALVDMPYRLKVIATGGNMLDTERLEHILYIINDRTDLAFLMYEDPLNHTAKDRIMGYTLAGGAESLRSHGEILLVDVFNRIIQIYDADDPNLYGELLEDISYAFPMVDFRLEKLADNAKQDGE